MIQILLASLVPILAPPLLAPALPARGEARGEGLRVELAADRPVLLGCVAPGTSAILLAPLVTRSEHLPRAVPVRGRVAFLLHGPPGLRVEELSVAALAHRTSERVCLEAGAPVLTGEVVLPREVTRDGEDELPQLARPDTVAVLGGELEVGPPSAAGTDALLLVGAGPPDGTLVLRLRRPDGAESALEVPTAPGAALIVPRAPAGLRLLLPADAPLGLDQLAYVATHAPVAPERELAATGSRPDAAGALPGLAGVEPGPAGLRVEVEVPDVEEGREEERTWTLVLRVRAAERTATAPVEAAAGPEASPAPAPSPRAGLVDATLEAGLSFCHLEGPDLQLDIRPTMGPGAACGDVDGDGWVDLYLVQGSGREGSRPPRNRMWRNRGDGGFEDVTDASGTGDTGAGMGALLFDAEGDGDLDLYVANRGADVLFENDGAGVFRDVSRAAGLSGERWSAGVAAADADDDGDLDLYVTSYLVYDEAAMPPDDELGRFRREDPTPMLPFAFPGERNAFLRNDSTGAGLSFTDVAEDLLLEDGAGRGMQPVFWDFDRDGRADLYVANDVSYNVLWRGEGGGSFRDVSFSTGMDDPRGGMGVAVDDVDGDGDEDLFLTNWQLEPNALYRNDLLSHATRKTRAASFRDVTVEAGLAAPSVGYTGWGAVFLDAELDGDLDLFVANGYTSPDYESTGICVGQPDHLYLNDGEGRFRLAPEAGGPALAARLASRAVVACDYDRDGDVDLFVTANNGPTRLLRNDFPRRGGWLEVRLRGPAPNPFAIGAEVTLRSGERLLGRRTLRAGSSYLGGNPPELHFGLGPSPGALSAEVRWPDGRVTRHELEGPDRLVELTP